MARAVNPFGNDFVIPGVLEEGTKFVSFPYGTKEHTRKKYEVLTVSSPDIVFWKEWSPNRRIPTNAVKAGEQCSGDVLYIGKNAQNRPGKLEPFFQHNCLYVSSDGREHRYQSCHVLCEYVAPPLTYTALPPHEWVPAQGGVIPTGALAGGLTPSGSTIYVSRARYYNQLVPGQLVDGETSARICSGSLEHPYENYEVLTVENADQFEWVWSSQGHVPANAVVAGRQNEEDAYAGRTSLRSAISAGYTRHVYSCHYGQISYPSRSIKLPDDCAAGTQLVGKIVHSHPCLYVPYRGEEVIYREYEVLVGKPQPPTLGALCRNVILHATRGIPMRVEKLPLPLQLKRYCQPDN